MDATNFHEFAGQIAASIVETWPVTITLSTGARVEVGKSATSVRRRPSEQGTGFVRRSEASFLFPQALSYRPDIGAQFTLYDTDTVAESGSVWRCYALTRGASGAPDRAECWKLES
jgi:hypothetical protein